MTGSYNDALVFLSVLIAAVASFTAFDLSKRQHAAAGWLRHGWLLTSALAMGGGIWAMHFVGMLAFQMPGMAVTYDVALTLLSFVVPVVGTGISFLAVARAGLSRYALGVGGAFMGLAIASMHYIGMAAMQMPAEVSYVPAWVTLSLVIAVGASTVALWLAGRATRLRRRLVAAGAMGLAISGMHYVAMAGAVFVHADPHQLTEIEPSLDPVALALAVAGSTFLLLLLALLAAINDSRASQLREQEATALALSEERFRTLYSCTPLPLHSMDREGRIEHVSDAWLELLGYSREEVVGRPLFEFMTDASARQTAECDWAKLIESGSLIEAECRFLSKTGRELEVRFSAQVERDSSGAFCRVLCGLIDDTKARQVEAELRQAQKMEALGKLTGGVAHDFNNLLAVMVGNMELLQRYVGVGQQQSRLIGNALKAAQRGAAITQRLLSFSRQQALQPVPVALVELVHGMRPLVEHAAGPGITIETAFPSNLDKAYVDPNQLETVLLNLVVNARDAMPDGGVLRIEAGKQSLPEQLTNRGEDYVCLAVIDTGHGMDAETLSRATDPFFTTKGVGKGTGLGLSMVEGVAAQSGGRLVIRSRPGEGTRVELWLPVARTPAKREHLITVVETPDAPRTLTVLVVEDDPLVLSSTVALLEDLGHHVTTAGSALDALARLRDDNAIDLVITDHLMPGMTGAELAELIRSEQPSMPLLLVSGYLEAVSAVPQGIVQLAKPFTQETLALAMRDALTERRRTSLA